MVSGCCGSVVEDWRPEPGVLGLLLSDCQFLNFLCFRFKASYLKTNVNMWVHRIATAEQCFPNIRFLSCAFACFCGDVAM